MITLDVGSLSPLFPGCYLPPLLSFCRRCPQAPRFSPLERIKYHLAAVSMIRKPIGIAFGGEYFY